MSRFTALGFVSRQRYNCKFEILAVKIFNLKQKANKIHLATIEKIKFCLFKKIVYGSFRHVITMEKSKTKAIQAELGIFTHIPEYSGIFRHVQDPNVYSGP